MNYLTNCLFASIGNYGYYYNTMEGSGRNQLKKYERDIVPLIVYNIHHFHVSFFVMYVRFPGILLILLHLLLICLVYTFSVLTSSTEIREPWCTFFSLPNKKCNSLLCIATGSILAPTIFNIYIKKTLFILFYFVYCYYPHSCSITLPSINPYIDNQNP